MKKKVILSVGAVAVGAAALAVAMLPSHEASTYGPNREWFKTDAQAGYPVFNSITDNPAIGKEYDFVRIMEVGTTEEYVNTVKVVPGREYQVMVYYRNDADVQYNDVAHNNQGVATNVKMSSSFPSTVKAGEKGEIKGTITWKNFDGTDGKVTKVYDEAYITADTDVKIALKAGTAKIYNNEKFNLSGTALDASQLFSSAGALLGVNQLDGVVQGGEEFAGQVVYSLTVSAPNAPAPATPAPETPAPEVPVAGPADSLGLAIMGGIFTTVIVYTLLNRNSSKR